MNNKIWKYFLIFFTIVIVLELGIYVSDYDTKLVKKSLFYFYYDLPNHKISENNELLYELQPYTFHSYENNRKVTINEFGFRDKKRTKEKPENITRIIIVGSSNTYGFEVSDNETYPFQLENYLNENYQGNYEVWNAGISSYMLSQELELSKRVIKNYNPDILIIQLANEGRRFFLEDYDTTVFLNNNKELFHENIPLLISGNNFFRSIHHFFIEYSGMYRIISMKINQLIVKINLEDNCENITCLKQKYYVRYYYYGDYVSQKKLNDFLSEDYDFEIIFFDPVFVTTFNIDLTKKNIHYFYLNSSNKPEEYMLLHPPSHVYAYYVNQLGNYLETNNLIEK
ncbi:hypothetical protein HOF18_03750 [archaeon]|nr:hypothetical protein [archaeon]